MVWRLAGPWVAWDRFQKDRKLERKAEGDVGVYQTGARLTDGEGRRRAHFSSRASSVGPD